MATERVASQTCDELIVWGEIDTLRTPRYQRCVLLGTPGEERLLTSKKARWLAAALVKAADAVEVDRGEVS